MDTRTYAEMLKARDIINKRLSNPNLSSQQKILFTGMSCALVWASGGHNNTMQMLLGGRPVAVGHELPEKVVEGMYKKIIEEMKKEESCKSKPQTPKDETRRDA